MLDAPEQSAAAAALALGPHCSVAAVTDGSKGSCISTLGRLLVCGPAATWPDSPTPEKRCPELGSEARLTFTPARPHS